MVEELFEKVLCRTNVVQVDYCNLRRTDFNLRLASQSVFVWTPIDLRRDVSALLHFYVRLVSYVLMQTSATVFSRSLSCCQPWIVSSSRFKPWLSTFVILPDPEHPWSFSCGCRTDTMALHLTFVHSWSPFINRRLARKKPLPAWYLTCEATNLLLSR